MESIEFHIDALTRELVKDYIALSLFIEHHEEDLTDAQIERLAEELEGDPVAIRSYVSYALKGKEDDFIY